MDFKTIRNLIVSELYRHLQKPVVPTDTNQPKPPYPFVSYKFTSLYLPQGGRIITHKVVPSENTSFEYDIEKTRIEQPQMVLSVNSYSLDGAESASLAEQVRAWFQLQGRQYLKDNGIVVVGVTSVQDRTLQIVDNFEVRYGFDVSLRIWDEHKTRLETIETVDWDKFEFTGG